MTDISNALKSAMQQEHCSSLYALLFLKGENQDDEQLLHKPTDVSEQISDNEQFNQLGARNRGGKGLATYTEQ